MPAATKRIGDFATIERRCRRIRAPEEMRIARARRTTGFMRPSFSRSPRLPAVLRDVFLQAYRAPLIRRAVCRHAAPLIMRRDVLRPVLRAVSAIFPPHAVHRRPLQECRSKIYRGEARWRCRASEAACAHPPPMPRRATPPLPSVLLPPKPFSPYVVYVGSGTTCHAFPAAPSIAHLHRPSSMRPMFVSVHALFVLIAG